MTDKAVERIEAWQWRGWSNQILTEPDHPYGECRTDEEADARDRGYHGIRPDAQALAAERAEGQRQGWNEAMRQLSGRRLELARQWEAAKQQGHTYRARALRLQEHAICEMNDDMVELRERACNAGTPLEV